MNNYGSFQGVLDTIVRTYILNELPPEVGESGERYQNIPERDLGCGFPQAGPQENLNVNRIEGDGQGQPPGTSASGTIRNFQNEREYVGALYQCFEKRGVFKELQTFLRHKLVQILRDEWPDVTHTQNGSIVEENAIIFRLVEDFLKCHSFLYTLSVLASEADVKSSPSKVAYGKLSSKEAEDLLDQLGIKRSTRLSGQILKCYFDKTAFSLLESMHYLGVWVDGIVELSLDHRGDEDNVRNRRKRRENNNSSGEVIFISHQNNDKVVGKPIMKDAPVQCEATNENILNVERRILEMERRMDNEKESKLREAIERYKNEDQARLREEMEANFQLKLIAKDREHFLDVQKRIEEMNEKIQRERQTWIREKISHEKELFETRKKLSEAKNDTIYNHPQTVILTESRQALPSSPKPQQPESLPMTQVTPTILKCSCKCDCSKKKTSREEKRPLATATTSVFDSIQQDQLVFLQYKLEQQDSEIQSLRKQLLLSPRVIVPLGNSRSSGASEGNAQRKLVNQIQDQEEDGVSDDLGSFLMEAKNRVGKLDAAVSKVDEIVQEVLTKKRDATPVYSHLSATLQAASEQRRLQRSLFTSTQPFYSDYSERSMSMLPGALVQQQLPEKQVKFKIPDIKMYSTFHYDNVASASEPQNLTQAVTDNHKNGRHEEKALKKQGRIEEKVKKQDSFEGKAIKTQINSEEKANNERAEGKASTSRQASFEEKAIKHGALSREKVSSSDDGDNDDCRSVSIAESISISLAKGKSFGGGGGDNSYVEPIATVPKAILKSRSEESSTSSNSKRKTKVKQLDEGLGANISLTLSSSTSRKSNEDNSPTALKTRSNKRSTEETESDQNDLSNISAPKSEDIQDFWQL